MKLTYLHLPDIIIFKILSFFIYYFFVFSLTIKANPKDESYFSFTSVCVSQDLTVMQ